MSFVIKSASPDTHIDALCLPWLGLLVLEAASVSPSPAKFTKPLLSITAEAVLRGQGAGPTSCPGAKNTQPLFCL